MIKDFFKTLGAGKKETESYLLMLKLGAQPASVLAKKMGLARSSMYESLEKLKKLELAESFERSGVLYFTATDPELIETIFLRREKALQQSRVMFQESLAELEAMRNQMSVTPVVKFFEGKDAVSRMYREIVERDKFSAFFNPETVKKKMPEFYYKVAASLKKRGGRARELLTRCKDAEEYARMFGSAKHEIRIMPKGVKFHVDQVICEDCFYMISYGEDEIVGTKISDKSLTDFQQALFDQLWQAVAGK